MLCSIVKPTTTKYYRFFIKCRQTPGHNFSNQQQDHENAILKVKKLGKFFKNQITCKTLIINLNISAVHNGIASLHLQTN